ELSLSGERAAAPVPLPRSTPLPKPVKKDRPSEPSDTQVSRIDEAFAPPRPPSHGIVTRSSTSRVLLVEDDPAMRDLVKSMLEADGLQVDTAESGEAAAERTVAETFDLMVLDWNLPGMSGIELCRKLRRDQRLAIMPILFLTGHASSRDVVEAFSSGADDFVSKPFRAPELNARILGLLRRARVSEPSPMDDYEEPDE
ncbi:MAG: response regulator transcription factor, partial [Polyangiaceae bacterium]